MSGIGADATSRIESDVDRSSLEAHLAASVSGAVTEIAVLADGLNLLLEIGIDGDKGTYVLRRPNKLRNTDLFVDLKREYRVMERLQETDVPAPAPVSFCDDESIVGDSFLVMTALDGATIPLGSDLPERFRTPSARERVAELVTETLAEIHSVDAASFEDVCDHYTPREQVERATERIDEAASVTGRELPTLRSVGEWLRQNAPAESETTLVHGDFRPGNVLFAGADRPEITGVLDWETAMLGDPLTELGYLLLRWRDEGDPTPSLDDLEARYGSDAVRQLRATNEDGLAPFTAKAGSPSRRELVARYEDETGRSFENDRFYRAHAAFVLAAVWEDLHRHRVAAGEDSDWEPHVDYMAMLAESIVDGELEL